MQTVGGGDDGRHDKACSSHQLTASSASTASTELGRLCEAVDSRTATTLMASSTLFAITVLRQVRVDCTRSEYSQEEDAQDVDEAVEDIKDAERFLGNNFPVDNVRHDFSQ